MKLANSLFENENQLVKLGMMLPTFNYETMQSKTTAQPKWLHFGAGNIFRAFLAPAQQALLNEGVSETGIVVVEGYDYEIVDILRSYDNLTLNVTLKSNGEAEHDIIASIAEYLKMDQTAEDFQTIRLYFRQPSLQLVSFTITEKGYSLIDKQGEYFENVVRDFESGPSEVTSYIGKLVSLLVDRFEAGALPLALVSMDNMSENGSKLEAAVLTVAEKWQEKGFVSAAFLDYLKNRNKISFPWSMIDKITPRPHEQVQQALEEIGFEEMAPTQTSKNTFVAPYVNGEETEYLIIEDAFPNGRPQLDRTGIIFTDRKTVNAVETMKVTTCLNPLHTALAIFGCLLGYQSIHEEMNDPDLVALIKQLGYQEGLPVVLHPGIVDPKQFLDEVIEVRLPNPFIPDTPQRIASDTSQKLPVRFGHTLKKYMDSTELDIQSLKAIPLVYAGWLRYLSAVDDFGESFELSPDPFLASGNRTDVSGLMKNEKIMGVDLFESGIGETVWALYEQMSEKPGAVRATIQSVIGGNEK